jgi:hypothetical protein
MQAVKDAGFVQTGSGEYTRDWDLGRGVLRWCVPADTERWGYELQFSEVGETTVYTYGFSEAAARLAADINAAKPGSTVTLSGRAALNTALTVPEGVTLDLTAEGAALELQDGAVLTVNGVVNATGHGDHGAGWVEGSLRMGDEEAVIDGSGTINLTSKGRLLNIGSDKGKRQLTLVGVTLVGLPDNDSPLVGVHENGAFILKSGAITGNTLTSDKYAGGGGVGVWRGTFTMEGGTISGNSANGIEGSSGGGVHVGEDAVFTMRGGAITDNSVTGDKYAGGGGIGGTSRGMFIMEGGMICGNSANGKGGSGVYIDGEAVFIMSGGEITGNTASAEWPGGGGVSVWQGTFTMEGGTISGNSANGKGGSSGGGISIGGESSTFTIQGGTIYGKADRIPAGTDASLANSARFGASLNVYRKATAKWGTGGTYTKGGVSQSDGSDIAAPIKDGQGSTDDNTLIAVPGK